MESNYVVPTGGIPPLTTLGELLMKKAGLLPKQVGDVNSTAKGSGARYNLGKAAVDLLPLRSLYDYYQGKAPVGNQRDALATLAMLALWQEAGLKADLDRAINAFTLQDWHDCANVFDYGRKKYAEWNWAKGMAWSIPLACAIRHLMAILEGEELDPESGLPHKGHVFANILMILTFIRTFPEGDDRPRYLL